MNETEKKILDVMKEIANASPDEDVDSEAIELVGLLEILTKQSFGTSSPEFINHVNFSVLQKPLLREKFSSFKYFTLWLHIEDYLFNKNNTTLTQEKLSNIEEILKESLKGITPETKASGTAILPRQLVNPVFIKTIYLLNDENLSNLFLKYLPAPKAKLFVGSPIPEIIAKREHESTQTIINFFKKNKNLTHEDIEHKVTAIQRIFRAKQRKKEDQARVSSRYKITQEETKQLLSNASKPYTPQCEPQLAARIMQAAEKVKLFSEVNHLTAASALTSIFNDGLHGRRSMLHFYMPFKPAALYDFDIQEGDSNVICLGANAIDPGAKHGIKLKFDAKKISRNNPCIFYKQRDLGYTLEKIRNVKIGDLDLHFSHTQLLDHTNIKAGTSAFQLFHDSKQKKIYAYATVKNTSLVAYNLEKMHQILTLNFFRYIDRLMSKDDNPDTLTKEKIYSALSKLDDKALAVTLESIGKNMTDTMEFNFYGIYKIDFSALLAIKNDNRSYTLHLKSFIMDLKKGNIKELNEAKKRIPELFSSYRFIDYLLSTTNNAAVTAELNQLREKCILPPWMELKF